jgi:hypothetical protein
MATREQGQIVNNSSALAKKLDAVGWGFFFIWIGIAVLAHVGWGVGLVGVGVIAVAAQVARKYFGLPVERVGLVIGIVFVAWGVWELLSIELGRARMAGGLLPTLCIVLGVAFVVSALLRRPRG